LRQIGEAECIHLATHMSWKLSAIVLSPGSDIVDPEHPKRFFSPSAASSSGGMAGPTATVSGVSAASDQGDEEGSEVCECHQYYSICVTLNAVNGQTMAVAQNCVLCGWNFILCQVKVIKNKGKR